MQTNSQRPGVVFYFSARPALNRLSNEELGILFRTIIDYAECNVEPNFIDDPLLGMAWDFIKPTIDSDRLRYDKTCTQNTYKVFKRDFEKNHPDEDCPEFESWLDAKSIDCYGHPLISADNRGYQEMSNDIQLNKNLIKNNKVKCNSNNGFASDTDVKEVAAMLMASIK